MRIASFGKSVQGKDHLENEDGFLIDMKLNLFAVADGVSIPKGGREATQKILKYLKELFKGDLKKDAEETNEKFVEEKQKENFEGYTTVVAAHLDGNILQVCNVGDSSALLLRKNKLEILTRIDRLLGTDSLIQAMGQEFINIHSNEVELKECDYIILVTDGVTDVLSHEEIINTVKRFKEPKEIVEEMIRGAEKKLTEYNDDKTVIVIRVVE